jgi:hypothetical protein
MLMSTCYWATFKIGKGYIAQLSYSQHHLLPSFDNPHRIEYKVQVFQKKTGNLVYSLGEVFPALCDSEEA